jgi:O-antigen ligase
MFDLEKRAYWPSFFMFIAIVLALVISIINGYVFWWLSVSIIFLLSFYYFDSRLIFNPLTIAVFLFVLLLTLNMVFVRPANDPDAGYLIGFFASGFMLFSFANEKFIKQSVYSLSGLFLLLALWGLVQYLTGYGYLVNVGLRANAIFFTPNTYAACLNVILLPVAILYLHIKGTGKLLPLILILFAALLVSQSRGGWVAFTTSLLFIFILTRILHTSFDRKKIGRLTIGFILVFSVYSAIELVDLNKNKTDFNLVLNKEASHLLRSESVVSTLEHRFMLYHIAWQQIKEKPLFGQGFHTYRYFQLRDQQVPHIGNVTRFAHNDYLQLWMETGIFGLVLFISIPAIIIGMLLLLWKKLSVPDRAIMLSLTTALVSFYVQALVDFLFYTPFLLMIYGCYLGYINQLLNKYHQSFLHYNLVLPRIMLRPIVVKSLVGLVVVCYLSQPAIAQLAFDQANRYKTRLDIESALTAYELARRFAPYESSYYLVEADIWYHAAKATGKSEPAQRADRLFEKGVAANPYRVANLFWRAILHRDLPELLSNPVSRETVLSWLQYVLHWLPHDQQAQAEYIRTLSFMRQYNKAKQLLSVYLEQSPDSYHLKQVQLDLEAYPE